MTAAEAAALMNRTKDIDARMEELDTERFHATRDLEAQAHALAQALHIYTRSGQYPHLREIDGDRMQFSFSNGIDKSDDGSFSFTAEDLAEDPERAAARFAKAKADGERAAARAALREAERRAARLGVR